MGRNQGQDQDKERTTVNKRVTSIVLRKDEAERRIAESAKQKSRKRNKAAAQSRRRNRR